MIRPGGRRRVPARLLAVGCAVLALAAPRAPASTRAEETGPPRLQESGPARAPIFVGRRHADTTDSRGPYVVAFRQIAGAAPVGGRLFYTVGDAGGQVRAGGEAPLRRGGRGGDDDGVWTGGIPGQEPGSIVTYHARFATADGSEWRHPGREPAEYRFRVVTLRVVSVDLPDPAAFESGRPWTKLWIEAAAPPAGELILRVVGGSSDGAEERRLPLSVRAGRRSGPGPARYELRARLPPLEPGGVADFFFRLRAAGGPEVAVPADAPARTWSARRPLADVRPIEGGRPFVLDLAADDDRRWVGLKGGGLWIEDRVAGARRVGGGAGRIASVARFVLPDPVSGRTFVGTDEGILAIDGAGDAWLQVGPPRPSAWSDTVQGMSGSAGNDRAGPGVLSPLDGTLLAQVQREGGPGSSIDAATVMELRDDVVHTSILPAPGLPLIGLSAAAFDAPDGCRLLGGYLRQGAQGRRAAILRSCGGAGQPIALGDPMVDGGQSLSARITALARDPRTDAVVVAIEAVVNRDTGPAVEYGLFAVDMATGRPIPVAPGADRIGAEVTALVTDWARGALVVGTIGRGVLLLRDGALHDVALPEGIPDAITALRLEEPTGSILVGTAAGAFAMPAGGGPALPIGPRGGGPSLEGFMPEDLDPDTRRLLFASETAGVMTFRRSRDGAFRIDNPLQPGRDLPEGSFGDARFLPGGGLGVVLRSRGLLLLEAGRQMLIGPADGLHSPHVLRFLARRAGELWVAHLPLPFGAESGAAVQILRDRRVAATIPIAGRDAASIARWVEVPGRDSVLAATAAGVIEFRADGTFTRLSGSAASAIAHDPATGAIAVVGAGVERWNGEEFVPVLFALRHPRRPRGGFSAGPPIDIAIGKAGLWSLLFAGGIVAQIDPDRGFLGLLDREDGIPRSATRLLADPRTGEILVGAALEGPAVIVSRAW